MKWIYIILAIGIVGLIAQACKTQRTTADNSLTSVDWTGSYSGILPCADCEGIATTVVLHPDRSYSMRTQYVGKDETLFNQEGTFTWNAEGSTITLQGIKDGPHYYKVGENQLIQLDMQGQPITGANAGQYVLTKGNNSLTNKYWKLVEIMGQPVATDDTLHGKEPHLILHTAENRVSGNGGCNGFGGTYQLDSVTNRLRFSPLMATKMACLESNRMKVEDQLFKALEATDSYHVKGDSLQLFKARMAPLARFVAVYLK